jgi:ATP-dependent protease ClpP protease subunit
MSDKLKDSISLFHDHGIYTDRRTVTIIGSIDEAMFDRVFNNLHVLDAVDKPINVVICSEGGEVTHARGIYDAIRGCQSYVTTIVYGQASSSASIILQAGDHRICTPSSKVMIHVGEEGVPSDHPRNLDDQVRSYREDETWIEDRYLERIREKKKRYTRNQVKSLLQFNRTLSPKELEDLGLIDEIGESL